ncbi:MAG: excinuclease ABC subunit UvrA [Corynebacterium sp.]|uniref:excinuclease ABC subunit UvrA n=1 Tax=Corynebacterium sp. TaxID=1720 RepID=UPI002649156A|nr:excinuclease ABC subunit UvrA [Corynebacterium sp.]MDN6283247.1 excinuclease ABC subunit UvrA [Corynebacterium sp.]MDN6305520.1 excinuclease ABC subunit UvrA [Corynebacterium sp.]MDN6375973.1 excinuclease ABC subunit UvrA [Corynebacterium sp.]MDN6396291.1 excinuclease ABC subunit UvrA [Corynebacterium sp.]MDN6404619.1 excinuclease ABC subunit UvrA [Corynebacterium sp.]
MVDSTHPDSGMIRVHDAHLRNLRHVDVKLPRDCLVAITGVSGSGKSSLAFGTIHGEAQRRYLESVAPFARRLIAGAVDPKVARVEGLPPSVALEQARSAGGARSTVGTFSTVSNSVRLLFSRCGEYPDALVDRVGRLDSDHFSPNTAAGMCPTCQGTGTVHAPTEASMVPDASLSIDDGAVAAWPGAWLGKNFHDILVTLGYDTDVPWSQLSREDRDWILFTEDKPVVTVHPVRGAHQIQRTYDGTWRSVAVYLRETLASTGSDTTRNRVLSFMEESTCPDCQGRRLTSDALAVTYRGFAVDELNALSLDEVLTVVNRGPGATPDTAPETAPLDSTAEAERLLLDQVVPTLTAAIDLGLGHLSLDRPARTLSAGEMQRLRLASQLHSGLFGVVYVLDEPSAGLHPTERTAVRDLMRRFVDAGNSVILVEHDMSLVAGADWVIDVGPGAGEHGGQVLWSGPVAGQQTGLAGRDTPTGRALAASFPTLTGDVDAPRTATSQVPVRTTERTLDIDTTVGLGQFTAVSGVSGSGKSTLVSQVLPSLLEDEGLRTLLITQQPIGRTPRSTLATYTGLFDRVRKLFASTGEARKRGWTVSRFSYNVTEGRCPTCNGEGTIEVELVFLPGSYTTCPDCHGARYNAETLQVTWHGYTVADILDLTVAEAGDVFADEPQIAAVLQALHAVGLDYLRLGQGAPELSGGEAQRIKLATELQRSSRTRRRTPTVHLLDEPTTGLHPADVDLLVTELHRLVDAGDSVVVVEHDLRVVAQADRVIDLGPGAGADGGRIIADGTPAEVAGTDTATGRALSTSSS